MTRMTLNCKHKRLLQKNNFCSRPYFLSGKEAFHMDKQQSNDSALVLRCAEESDIPVILWFIKGLAEYEKMSDQVVATEALLKEWLFEKHKAEVLIAEYAGEPAGFSLFFHNFSTSSGRAGLYLEDLFVLPDKRGLGIGKALLQKLAAIAVERGCGRLEWCCLDWNQPSIDFYRTMGAIPMSDWTIYRLAGETLQAAAEGSTH